MNFDIIHSVESEKIREKFLEFFKKRGHKIVSSASLVPEGDPSVLFTTAGMQQFKPYYLGEDPLPRFGSKNVVSVQKCLRTSDIDEVGDATHLTFFEMLGNFSFTAPATPERSDGGRRGYFSAKGGSAYSGKKEAIEYAHEFVTKELGLEIDYVTVFGGDPSTSSGQALSADIESEKVWREINPNLEIKKAGRADNFWGPTGEEGPCGPTTEIYVNGTEIWNLVFNEYFRDKTGKLSPLPAKGVDTGLGFERLLAILQKKSSIYETDLFSDIFDFPDFVSESRKRIILDHARAATFLVADGIIPSNKERGYVLRRLLRRAILYLRNFEPGALLALVGKFIDKYSPIYGNLDRNIIFPIIKDEQENFKKTLDRGLKEFERGRDAFTLFTTYGFPVELALELAKEKGIEINKAEFEKKMKEHQEKSRVAAAGMFKGGLANHEPRTVRHHTAHHLLLAALKKVLGPEVVQRGSNINEERLRLDFSFGRKMTEKEKGETEKMVNQKIKESLPVVKKEMPRAEAEKLGAEREFGEKYGEMVSVYFINNFSVEFCGGPHVANTGELGIFKILKEEAVAVGTRRLRAVLE